MRCSPPHSLLVSAVLTLAAASAFGGEPTPAQKPAAPASPLAWTPETPEQPLPAKYLSPARKP
jgi:hypothetical protein